MGQCYDCGKYYPVSKMAFNGRSYHCGCANVYCEECKKEIPYGQEVNVGDQCWLCPSCYSQYENKISCAYCGAEANPELFVDGEMVCTGCYNRIMSNREAEQW